MDSAATGFRAGILASLCAGLIAAVLGAGNVLLTGGRPAQALPQFATQTGLPCSQCHQTASGGPLTDFGKAFQANGNKLPAKK